MSASPVNWFWKLSSLTREVISEEKTHIEWKITKLAKKVTKCASSFETYFSYSCWEKSELWPFDPFVEVTEGACAIQPDGFLQMSNTSKLPISLYRPDDPVTPGFKHPHDLTTWPGEWPEVWDSKLAQTIWLSPVMRQVAYYRWEAVSLIYRCTVAKQRMRHTCGLTTTRGYVMCQTMFRP